MILLLRVEWREGISSLAYDAELGYRAQTTGKLNPKMTLRLCCGGRRHSGDGME